MKKSKLGALSVALPLGLGLSLALAACGGSSDNDGNDGGSGGSSAAGKANSGGTNASAAGTSSKAGTTSTGGTTGTGGKSTNPGNGTDVPGDTQLGDLTDDQFEQLCEDFSEKFSGEEFEDANCRLAGVLSAILAQTDEEAQLSCKSAYDDCKSSPPAATEGCEKPGPECTATVDEMNACMADLEGTLGSFNDAIPSCDTLKRTDIATLFTQFGGGSMLPASCETYQEKCPDGPMVDTGTDVMP